MASRANRRWSLLAAGLALAFWTAAAHATDRLVPAQYPTIQDAINAAVAGTDTVIVSDGVYSGFGNTNLDTLAKAITVRSENGPANCVIDGGAVNAGFSLFRAEQSTTVIQGFTITRAYANTGAGISLISGSSPTILDCVITASRAGYGAAGIYVGTDCAPTIRGCWILANQGTAIDNVGSLTLENCVIAGNTEYGIATAISGNPPNGTLIATNCVVVGNTTGGVYCGTASITSLTHCTVADNGSAQTTRGGGIRCYNGANLALLNSILWGNQASQGPQLSLESTSNATVNFCDVEGGRSYVYRQQGSTLVWADNLVTLPKFAIDLSESSLTSDYHLDPNSPCIDTGTNAGITEDADTNLRPLDAGYDMGAYEYNASQPSIAAAPPVLAFQAVGGQAPDDQELWVANAGGGTLDWSVTDDAAWLDVTPPSGSGSALLTVSVDVTGLPAGEYAARILIAATGAVNTPRVVAVTLAVGHVITVNWDETVPADFRTIQAAIMNAVDGDEVVVADGVYSGDNNVNLNTLGKAILVHSENGPGACIIDCQGQAQAFYLSNGEDASTVIEGFTITGGKDWSGMVLQQSSPTIRNCIIRNCRNGLECYNASPILTNSVITANSASGLYCWGPSTSLQALHCTIADNGSVQTLVGGGLYCYGSAVAELTNCILWANRAAQGSQIGLQAASQALINHCDVQGGLAGVFRQADCILQWQNNITADPQFVLPGEYHLQTSSPCIDAGTDAGLTLDADGNTRPLAGGFDIGASEYNGADPLIAASLPELVFYHVYTADDPVMHLPLSLANCGGATLNWSVTDHVGLPLDWLTVTPPAGAGDTQLDVAANIEFDIGQPQLYRLLPGTYTGWVRIDGTNGGSPVRDSPRVIPVTLIVGQVITVAQDGTGDYDTIQEAIDAAQTADVVSVTDGIYTGVGNTNLDTRGKTITVRSESGPDACIIDCDGQASGFYIHTAETAATIIDGFTIAGGQGSSGFLVNQSAPTIRNCVVRNCTVGLDCSDASPVLHNCLIVENSDRGLSAAGQFARVSLVHCTVADNGSSQLSLGGGLYASNFADIHVVNSVLWANQALQGPQLALGPDATASVESCDVQGGQSAVYLDPSAQLTWNAGNIDADPLFYLPGDYHLQSASPCRDAGTDAGLTRDADDNLRPLGAGFDIGAYEYNAAEASLAVGPFELVVYGFQGGPNPLPQPLYLANCGAGALTWFISDDADWLQLDPPVGSSTGEVDTVNALVDLTGLLYGHYTATITVASPQAINSPRVVRLRLHLNRTIYVKPDGTGDYPTIQDAIDAAVERDIVLLADGTFTGPGNVNLTFDGKAITVRSENGPAACIIDCQDQAVGFTFLSAETRDSLLEGVTIRNANGAVAGFLAGGILCHGSSPTISDCVITNCQSASGGGITCYAGAAPLIQDCLIEDNAAISQFGLGGGLYSQSSSPTLERCTLRGNSANEAGGGIYSANSAALIKLCTIIGGAAHGDGGGIYLADSADRIVGSRVLGNYAAYDGAGIFLARSSPVLVGCLVAGNFALGDAGGLYCYDESSPQVIGCTFTGNSALRLGGALLAYFDCQPVVSSSILYADTAAQGPEIALVANCTLTADYSDVQGGQPAVWRTPDSAVTWGANNIDVDPAFRDPDGADNDPYTLADNDYHLAPPSPCIDAGDPAFVSQPGYTDMDGQPRVWPPAGPIDIGADEVVPGDLDHDGDVDLADYNLFAQAFSGAGVTTSNPDADLDGDGDCDLEDLTLFTQLLAGP